MRLRRIVPRNGVRSRLLSLAQAVCVWPRAPSQLSLASYCRQDAWKERLCVVGCPSIQVTGRQRTARNQPQTFLQWLGVASHMTEVFLPLLTTSIPCSSSSFSSNPRSLGLYASSGAWCCFAGGRPAFGVVVQAHGGHFTENSEMVRPMGTGSQRGSSRLVLLIGGSVMLWTHVCMA